MFIFNYKYIIVKVLVKLFNQYFFVVRYEENTNGAYYLYNKFL